MPTEERSYREKAEARFKRLAKQAVEAPIATQEYQAQQQHTIDRTKVLREQRLEREKHLSQSA